MYLEISGRPWGPSLPSFPQLSKKVFRGFPHSKHRAEAKDHEASIATKPEYKKVSVQGVFPLVWRLVQKMCMMMYDVFVSLAARFL